MIARQICPVGEANSIAWFEMGGSQHRRRTGSQSRLRGSNAGAYVAALVFGAACRRLVDELGLQSMHRLPLARLALRSQASH